MAGRRRGTGRLLRSKTRARRRREELDMRLGRASSPVQRVTAAAEYVRAVLVRLPPRPAELLADELVQVLTDAADAAARR